MMRATRVRPGQPAGQRHGNIASWSWLHDPICKGATEQNASGGRHRMMLAHP